MAEILVPVKAEETGLVPEGWRVKADNPESGIDQFRLYFFSLRGVCMTYDEDDYAEGRPDKDGRDTVGDDDPHGGPEILERALGEHGAIGSLGFGKLVLDAQTLGEKILTPERKDGTYCPPDSIIPLPLTILVDDEGTERIAQLMRKEAGLWQIEWVYFNEDWPFGPTPDGINDFIFSNHCLDRICFASVKND